jgi:hypothetical protein
MGEALRLPPGSVPRQYEGQAVGIGQSERSLPLSPSCRFFQIALEQKDPRPPAQKMGPICAGPCWRSIRPKKTSTQATHTATQKLLAGSTVTWSNFQPNTNVQSFGAGSGATVQV